MRRQTEILSQGPEVIQDHPRKRALQRSDTSVRIGVRRGRPPETTLHQITDHELEDLAGAGSHSIYFTWAITLLTTATAFLISLLTTAMSLPLFVIFVVLAAGGYGAALPCLIFWHKTRKSTSELLTQIKTRLN